ncbi:MAG TPA: hypothetical protein VG186_06390 [Solirubrobacteraceae bacterium]|jgi:hypothetical protein|nr:hypothetical protein [Solirubrobacteraceae bacterium]
MFRSSLNRILDWAENALAPIEDEWVLGEEFEKGVGEGFESRLAQDYDDSLDEREGGHGAVLPFPHPHRRELRWVRDRRPGSVPHRRAHCISPVRGTAAVPTRQGKEV